MADQKAVLVGISGASSSGKTTLARLLRDIFPSTFILHEDDFYKPESELPTREGLLDWDCAEAISVPDMIKALEHIRAEGTFPVPMGEIPAATSRVISRKIGLTNMETPQPFVDSKEDKNSVGQCPVSDGKIAEMKARVEAWTAPGQPGHALLVAGDNKIKVCLLDGFLLYSEATRGAMALLDARLFLLVSRARATRRREARDGYVTLEGFWADPPGYVDKVVWPNYAEAHAWLFEGGDVEGRLKRDVLEKEGILAQEGAGLDVDMETSLEWAVETLMGRLEAFGKR